MKIKSLFYVFVLVFLFFSMSQHAYSVSGYINDDIQCFGVEVNGEDSLYVTGELTYYVEEDKRFKATVLFYNIFDKVLARAYIKVTLKENDESVSFETPIYIDNESDPVEVKSAHHISWEVDTIEKIECCTNHGGIVGCDEDSGKLKCYDGVISKGCVCDEYDVFEE